MLIHFYHLTFNVRVQNGSGIRQSRSAPLGDKHD